MSKFIDRIADKALRFLSDYKNRKEADEYVDGIRNSYNKLVVRKDLTKEQEAEIQEYFTKYLGHPVTTDYHKYFYSRTGIYSKYYIPTNEYKTDIIGRLNLYPLKRAYTDKNVTDLILPTAHQPEIFLKNMNGYYYVAGKAVTLEDAVSSCSDLGEVIIKPSLTGRGKGVKKIVIKGGVTDYEGKSLETVLKEYGSDFLIEACIHQHRDMAALNPSSINTIRFVTYRSGMDVKIVYSVVRIGRKGQAIDNESAGGISAIIDPKTGEIGKYAYGAPGVDMLENTDSGARLEGYQIPSFEKAVAFVKEQHLNLPYFNMVGWDIAIEEDGTPIMIEFNMTPDLSQSANGPAFGEYTDEILKDAMRRRNTWSRIVLESIWKKNSYIK